MRASRTGPGTVRRSGWGVINSLRKVLEMRRCGADGEELGPDAFVFGNEIGSLSARSRQRGR